MYDNKASFNGVEILHYPAMPMPGVEIATTDRKVVRDYDLTIIEL